MNILIISDCKDKEALGKSLIEKVKKVIQEKKVNLIHHEVGQNNYKPCLGCFNCWVKTPGVCIINDGISKITDDFMKSDAVIVLTPLKYGCYSSSIKRILDRIIPNILPFFKTVNNEVHHAPRYKKYPQLIMIGYGEDITDEEGKTFKDLTNANAINMQISSALAYVCKEVEELRNFDNDLNKYIEDIRRAV